VGMTIAVLGLGRMGAALAERLLDGGHEVTVWNRSAGKAAPLVAAGAKEAGSVAAAAEKADVVLTSLSDDAAVRAVALGEGGLRACLPDGSTYVETSTVSPRLTGELAGTFSSFVAMPVLGGPASVLAGQATYLAGCNDSAFSQLEPFLPSFGGPVRRYGSAGLASTAKLAANLLMLSGAVALAESFAVGRSGGLEDDQLRELLSALVAPPLKARFEALLGGPWSGWWTTALGAKDAGLAIDIANGDGIELPVATAARDAYSRTAAEGYADEDIAAVRHLYDGRGAH